jgi:hypothetical protein
MELLRTSYSRGLSVLQRKRVPRCTTAGDGHEHWTLLATWDHISNAGSCSRNVGLNNYGLKLGYRF